MDGELARLIATADWDDLVRRLLGYAHLRTRDYPYGKTPGQYVEQAVDEVLAKKHDYTGGTLFQFLCSVVDDVIRRELNAR